jgi:23S rRNA (uracil1939-C5)-methyltransferase
MIGRFDAASTTLILDPPRTGCPPELLQALLAQRPRQVLYVSCHPATLARDLNVLCANNVFQVTKIVPLDMFPQTQHVECVADVRAHNSLRPSAPVGHTENIHDIGNKV